MILRTTRTHWTQKRSRVARGQQKISRQLRRVGTNVGNRFRQFRHVILQLTGGLEDDVRVRGDVVHFPEHGLKAVLMDGVVLLVDGK
eukprot:11656997-Heterocapsa_arctica.AAC.1